MYPSFLLYLKCWRFFEVFCWGQLHLWFLFNFLIFFPFQMSFICFWFLYSLYFLFQFCNCSFHFSSFHSIVCVFIDFLEELISFLFKYVYHIRKVFSMSLIHALAILEYLGTSVFGLLGSYGDTLS